MNACRILQPARGSMSRLPGDAAHHTAGTLCRIDVWFFIPMIQIMFWHTSPSAVQGDGNRRTNLQSGMSCTHSQATVWVQPIADSICKYLSTASIKKNQVKSYFCACLYLWDLGSESVFHLLRGFPQNTSFPGFLF